MAIKVSGERLFTLQTKDSSYQMYADEKDVLLHTYYGRRIDGENLAELIVRETWGFPEIRPRHREIEAILWTVFPRSCPPAAWEITGRTVSGFVMRTEARRRTFGLRAMRFCPVPTGFRECPLCTTMKRKRARPW